MPRGISRNASRISRDAPSVSRDAPAPLARSSAHLARSSEHLARSETELVQCSLDCGQCSEHLARCFARLITHPDVMRLTIRRVRRPLKRLPTGVSLAHHPDLVSHSKQIDYRKESIMAEATTSNSTPTAEAAARISALLDQLETLVADFPPPDPTRAAAVRANARFAGAL